MTDIVERLRKPSPSLNEAEFEKEDAADEIERLRAVNAELLAALCQLVADYEDTPDPTDTDGQAVFERARAAIERSHELPAFAGPQ